MQNTTIDGYGTAHVSIPHEGDSGTTTTRILSIENTICIPAAPFNMLACHAPQLITEKRYKVFKNFERFFMVSIYEDDELLPGDDREHWQVIEVAQLDEEAGLFVLENALSEIANPRAVLTRAMNNVLSISASAGARQIDFQYRIAAPDGPRMGRVDWDRWRDLLESDESDESSENDDADHADDKKDDADDADDDEDVDDNEGGDDVEMDMGVSSEKPGQDDSVGGKAAEKRKKAETSSDESSGKSDAGRTKPVTKKKKMTG